MSADTPSGAPGPAGEDGGGTVAAAHAARHAAGLTFWMCLSQFMTMLSISIYAAQLPRLAGLWSLNNTEAGWIGAAYFLGYTLTVPFFTLFSDRIDPKRIFILGCVLLALGCAGFGLFAGGIASAAVFHAVAGAGLAGSYFPGLKALLDHIDDRHHSRAAAFYTASFGFGAALSYPFSAVLGDLFGWPAPFYASAAAALAAGALIVVVLPPAPPHKLNIATTRLFDLRPVLRNRAAIAYTLAYTFHCWELFTFRTWVIAFLVYAERIHGQAPSLLGPAAVAAVFTLLGMPASILGNEIAMRFGRRRYVTLVLLGSAALCFAVAPTAEIGYALAALACLVHGTATMLDSASTTAGALGSAAPGYRGATMAVHATLGFGSVVFGPILFGLCLDLGGGQTPLGWLLAFAHLGAISLIGALVVTLMRPPPVPGDRQWRP